MSDMEYGPDWVRQFLPDDEDQLLGPDADAGGVSIDDLVGPDPRHEPTVDHHLQPVAPKHGSLIIALSALGAGLSGRTWPGRRS